MVEVGHYFYLTKSRMKTLKQSYQTQSKIKLNIIGKDVDVNPDGGGNQPVQVLKYLQILFVIIHR